MKQQMGGRPRADVYLGISGRDSLLALLRTSAQPLPQLMRQRLCPRLHLLQLAPRSFFSRELTAETRLHRSRPLEVALVRLRALSQLVAQLLDHVLSSLPLSAVL